ncbi:MAG: PKD domain-containing protein, partial [Acidobacteriota bacterium]|nr:PKD domain-containing protein [Acidobacteriota bacterium]
MFRCRLLNALCVSAILALPAVAAAPQVKTVAASASNSATPHGVLSGKQTTLKGTSSAVGAGIQARWDFGDGTEPAVFRVSKGYEASATHVYSARPGTAYTATLTVTDVSTGESASS